MAHPQGTNRGFFAAQRVDVGSSQLTYNSTGLVLSAAIYPSAGAGGKITADSTAVILSAVKIGTWSTAITHDTTGVLLGANYISTNSTGN